jgi:hypothetical protein
MNKYLIRFNKTRGKPGRGTVDHAWRVFENDQEYLVKNVKILVPSYSEKSGSQAGDDYNIACEGYMTIDKETSTITITDSK